MFATCAAIGGATADEIKHAHDSVSLIEYLDSATATAQRPFVFAESKDEHTGKIDIAVTCRILTNPVIKDNLVKLILKDYDKDKRPDGATREMYNLTNNPWEDKWKDLYLTGGNIPVGRRSRLTCPPVGYLRVSGSSTYNGMCRRESGPQTHTVPLLRSGQATAQPA